ncbi:MAG: hypothetical protein J6X66_08665 [Lachnospiraceae bacterium]|nr:hypothetical protein [Lachnospiraceae bacterium]
MEENNMKKKKILISVIFAFVMVIAAIIIIIGIFTEFNGPFDFLQNNSKESYNGEIKPAPEGIVAFRCWCSYGNNNGATGSSGSYINTVVIRDNTIHIFRTYSGSTADSGATTEYEKEISDTEIDDLRGLLDKGKWEQVYNVSLDMMYAGNKYTWYYGGEAFESVRMPDGTYRWAYFYDQLVNSDVVPERVIYSESEEEEE